tara:strand:- start:182 stop:1468 length:1287 start_codon:yes stop_codon:yes gene_type:complete
MPFHKNFKELSFLIYGLGLTGKSVVNFFKKNKIKNYEVWDDKNTRLFKNKRARNLNKCLNKVDYIVLSPGVSITKAKNKHKLIKYKKKIITDLDLAYLLKKFNKSIVVTGTNGKSTTCKILTHLLKKNKFKVLLGGNIGTPILDLEIKKNTLLVIEASSFQLAYSKFISPDYAFLLNITNDHIDWHGSMKNYFNAKFRIFQNQEKYQYSFLNKKFESHFKKRNFLGKLIIPQIKRYKKIKPFLKNTYLSSNINDENMSHIFALANLLKITNKSFFNSLNSFKGLPHRYEIFLKRKNCIFINDSKATSFEATKFALKYTKNIYWILGGLPKKKDKIILRDVKKNIKRSYIIGKNINFFKNQIQNKINFYEAKTLKNSIIQALKDISNNKEKNISLLFSPASASFDQFLNFEKRGEEFKKLSRFYARKYI